MLRRANIEAVAGAVDQVTERDGLTRGEALYVFTSMMLTSLENAEKDVRDVLRDAVIDSLKDNSMRALASVLREARRSEH